jgi:hypothetical protein
MSAINAILPYIGARAWRRVSQGTVDLSTTYCIYNNTHNYLWSRAACAQRVDVRCNTVAVRLLWLVSEVLLRRAASMDEVGFWAKLNFPTAREPARAH